ncbi:hypothetical protein P4S83_01825 [Aneurinibacillus thermoaerophilus]|uniref:phage tail fiber protein n=1 Tax=Aneurinibacillus thermoaerophilus TaxID=143495 RepID=UPI002E245CBE|nr:hypothetical protein [Aneurinibacillus thermoaerophilus]
MAMSNYLETAVLNLLRGVSFTPPTTVYIALYINDPTDADIGTEVTAVDYARQKITFGEPTQGADGKATIANDIEIAFPKAGTDWGTITHIGFRDAATGGNLLYYGALANPKKIDAGDRFRAMVGDFTLKLG